jgi:hypothetical protein
VTLAGEPLGRVVAESDLAGAGVDPLTAIDVCLLGGQPCLGLGLAYEGVRGDVPLTLVPVARLISAGRQLANAAELTPTGRTFKLVLRARSAHDKADHLTQEEGLPPLSWPNMEPGRRIELLSPDYKAGALPLSYPGQLDLFGATDNSMPEADGRRHGIGPAAHRPCRSCSASHGNP